ncbi:MAG TPA: NAD(P)H-hydrate epimerase, partial [Phycisphaerae bacterium]|nr:NAD(P)H-hydrate epimerase [Phycisphaerae bacterium]
NLRIAENFGLDVRFIDETAIAENLADELSLFHGIIDAIGGTGIVPPLTGPQALAAQAINRAADANAEINVFAIDIPTGLDCDSGQADGSTVKADLTVSYVSQKAGFANDAAKAFTGDVVTADIGIDSKAVIAMIDAEK